MDEGDLRVFLVSEYPRLVAALTLASGNRSAAEEAVQEALARAWERSERGERIESLPAWVTRVALNHLRSGFRRLRVQRRAAAKMAPEPWAGAAPFEDQEAAADVARALAALPRRQREATVLRYYLDMDVSEVARSLGTSEGTVKTTLHRARKALAVSLGEQELEEANDRV